MSFAFGFSGDDIDGHDNINNSTRQVEELLLGEKANPQEAVKVQKMSLKEMVSRCHVACFCGCLVWVSPYWFITDAWFDADGSVLDRDTSNEMRKAQYYPLHVTM